MLNSSSAYVGCVVSVFVLAFVASLAGESPEDGGEKIANSRHTLYFLSMLPYPDPEPSLNPSISDGPDLFPAVQLAVDHVNNRSDVLRDYHIELIETDGGCDISSKALISLVSQLFYSDKQIAGIIGPSCSESAEAVGALSRRSEIALLSIHLGSSPLLVNRDLYHYSVGIEQSPNSYVAALIALVEYAQWTKVAAVYSDELLVDITLYSLFEREVRNRSVEIAFSSETSERSIPYQQLRDSLSRVFIAFIRPDVATKMLCVAYHNGLVSPTYQWIFTDGFTRQSVQFYYRLRHYNCSEDDIDLASDGAVVLNSMAAIMLSDGNTVGGPAENVLEEYGTLWREYNCHGHNKTNTSAPSGGVYVKLMYDSVWAMALALNSSLETLQEKNMSLTNYTYGQSSATEVILEHLYRQVEFNGLSGRTSFESSSGFTKRSSYYLQYRNGSSVIAGVYSPSTASLSNLSLELVLDKETVVESVSFSEAICFIVVVIVTSFLVAFLHILNTVYENYKTIKASSSRLNHFAYVGCYCILLALLVYTIVEAFSTSPLIATTVLCNFIPWLISIGFSLVFGTAIVKTWRIHKVFFELELQRGPWILKDHFLSVFVLSLTAIDVVVCILWSSVDPLHLQNSTALKFVPEGVVVNQVCTSNYVWVWSLLLLGYKLVLQVVGMLLSLWTSGIEKENFKTRNIKYFIPLSFILILTASVPISLVSTRNDISNVNIHYTILCVVVIALVYLCWGLLFLPPVLPLLREKCCGKTRRQKQMERESRLRSGMRSTKHLQYIRHCTSVSNIRNSAPSSTNLRQCVSSTSLRQTVAYTSSTEPMLKGKYH